MNSKDGILEFEYFSKSKQIPYTLNASPGYGGKPMITIKSKHNFYYTFVRTERDGWGSVGKTPSWPMEFLVMLFLAFEEKYKEFKQFN